MRKALAVFLLAACTSSTQLAVCNGTVSGALKGTFSVCDDFDDVYLANMNTTTFTADYTELPTVFTFTTAWTIPEDVSLKNYTNNTMDLVCSVTVAQGSKQWNATHGGGSPAQGNCALDFTVMDAGITSLGTEGNITAYQLQGQLRSHLEAVSDTGATDTIDLSMGFDGKGALR